jgi:hypothetical protein
MKFYFHTGACSVASHVVLLVVGAIFILDQVDIAMKQTQQAEGLAIVA